MTITTDRKITLETVVCGECDVTFAMPAEMMRHRRETGGAFYCPNGHGRVYRQSEVDRLKDELTKAAKKLEVEETRTRHAWNRVTEEREAHDATRNSLRAVKGVLTKTKKRIVNSVCPVCHRSFGDTALTKHLATKHPDYAKEESSDGS